MLDQSQLPTGRHGAPEIRDRQSGGAFLTYTGAQGHVSESVHLARARQLDRMQGTDLARKTDAWQYRLPGAASWYSHPTREGAILAVARDLVAGMDSELPDGNGHLSPNDRCTLARIIRARDLESRRKERRPGPGDYIRTPAGNLLRIAYVWPTGCQTVTPGAGRFHLDDFGFADFSGSLDPIEPGSDRLRLTGETRPASYWRFSEGGRRAHNGVDLVAPAPVWQIEKESF